MHVSLYEEKSNKSGMTSLILHTVVNGSRSKRALGIYFKTNPQTESEKRDKKEKLLIANKIANVETARLLNGEYMLQEQYRTSEDFVAYAEQFIAQHPVKDKRKYTCGLNYLKQYVGKSRIPCFEITETLLQRFAKYLEQRLNGETAFGYFSKLKQIITAATDDLYFRKNPALRVKIRQQGYRHHEALTTEELRALHSTAISNHEVKRAFLFACRTGLRWVDIKQLRWENIKNQTVILRQAKTGVSVSIPLDQDSMQLLGECGAKSQLVFTLPSHTGALKCLKKWAEAAGVQKHIGFHTARRTFGTSLITYGSDVSIVSKLLGHTSLANTQRYVKVSEQLKQQAIAKLPSLMEKTA